MFILTHSIRLQTDAEHTIKSKTH